MVVIVAIFNVADFAHWRRASSGYFARAAAAGGMHVWIYRAVDDADEVMVMIEARSREQAESMMQPPSELVGMLEAAGVAIYPAVFLGEQVEELTFE